MPELPNLNNNLLLTSDDPHPVEIFRVENSSPVLIVCDHAGNAVPKNLQQLMPKPEDMNRHIAIDVGARTVAQIVARALNSNLIMQRYSRLVIDMNRPLDSPELCPEVSDGTPVPFNQNLTDNQKKSRVAEIFETYHNSIAGVLGESENPPKALVAIHSFTPRLRDHPPRFWHFDLISRAAVDLALELKDFLQSKRPEYNYGVNEIFSVSDSSDYTLRTHAENRGLLGLSIETRNDLLTSDTDVKNWADLLANGLQAIFTNRIPRL